MYPHRNLDEIIDEVWRVNVNYATLNRYVINVLLIAAEAKKHSLDLGNICD
jgi:hypothetical protein